MLNYCSHFTKASSPKQQNYFTYMLYLDHCSIKYRITIFTKYTKFSCCTYPFQAMFKSNDQLSILFQLQTIHFFQCGLKAIASVMDDKFFPVVLYVLVLSFCIAALCGYCKVVQQVEKVFKSWTFFRVLFPATLHHLVQVVWTFGRLRMAESAIQLGEDLAVRHSCQSIRHMSINLTVLSHCQCEMQSH